MKRTHSLHGYGVLSIVGGGLAIWYAFEHPICKLGGVESQCAPNVVFLIPGITATLVGIELIWLIYLHDQAAHSQR